MTEDADAAQDNTFKVSDLRRRFEGAKGSNPLKPAVAPTGAGAGEERDSRPPSSNGAASPAVPTAAAAATRGAASGNEPRPPSSSGGVSNGAAAAAAVRGGGGGSSASGNELRPPLPSKPQQLPQLRPPALPTKPAHPFGSRPGPSSATATTPGAARPDSEAGPSSSSSTSTTTSLQLPKAPPSSSPSRKKPPLAPKPAAHLLADYKPAPTAPERHESLTKDDKSEELSSVRVRAKLISGLLRAQAASRMSIQLAKEGESSLPATPIALGAPALLLLPPPLLERHGEKEEEEGAEVRVEMDENGRTRHESAGEESEDDEADDFADSIDSEESRSTADTHSNHTASTTGTFGRRSGRYASSTSGYGGSAETHANIMKEMMSRGIALGGSSGGSGGSSNASALPHSLGKMRAASTRQQARSVSGSALHTSSSSTIKSDLSSVASATSFLDNSSGSGITASTATSGGPSALQEVCVPDYATGDEKEDSRLKKLHYAALEFLTVQRMFVEYLNMIINVYPAYLEEWTAETGRPVLPPATASTTHHVEGLHVVARVQKLLIPYYEFHKLLLEDISKMMEGWTSHDPQMSTIFARTAPFLKQCVPFLKEKSKIADEMTRLIKEDNDFMQATLLFEQQLFKRGVGAVIQQLDQVHQNFMRYKLLMLSYIKFLPEGSEEWTRTDSVIRTLERINMEVNTAMGLPTSDQLMRLATLFQGQFNVFEPGRRLIRQENVDKQTRKETQPRTLVLFSDTLWLCRSMSSLGSAGMFDMARSYSIPIEEVRLQVQPHVDYDCYMEILSKRKSAGLWFKCASARDEWRALIEKEKKEKIAHRERLQTARKRSSRTALPPAVGGDEESLSSSSSSMAARLSRTDSGLQQHNGAAAAAAASLVVPTRTAPPPPPLARPHSIIVAEGGGAGNGSLLRRPSEDDSSSDTHARSYDDEDDEEAPGADEADLYDEEELTTPVVGGDDPINGSSAGHGRPSPDEQPRRGHKPSVASSSSHSQSPSLEVGEQPVWINDQMSTKCLMDGCENEFNIFQRRHHCRNCGWLICKKCRGYAPVRRARYGRELVCPECYDDIEAEYHAGTLFPRNLLVEVDKGVYHLAVTKGKKGKERIERVNPGALFSPPAHRGLRRMRNIDERLRCEGDAASGRILLKTKRGETEMHAHLDGLILRFYKAAFDKHPTEQHVIYGFALAEEDAVTESGRVLSGKRFNLRHTNQHGSASERTISFRVVSDSAAKMWSAALCKALREETLDDDENY